MVISGVNGPSPYKSNEPEHFPIPKDILDKFSDLDWYSKLGLQSNVDKIMDFLHYFADGKYPIQERDKFAAALDGLHTFFQVHGDRIPDLKEKLMEDIMSWNCHPYRPIQIKT